MANLSYIRHFCFSHSSKDELSYCLSTFEAAVEYINLGRLKVTHNVSLSLTHTCAHLSKLTRWSPLRTQLPSMKSSFSKRG